MTAPSIEIRWGDRDYPEDGILGINEPVQRDMLRPKIERAIDVARWGLDTFGVEWSEPKRIVVHSLAPNLRNHTMAHAVTAKTMHLYLLNSAARGRFNTGAYGLALLHELMHGIRLEKIPILTLGEAAATEGISYISEYTFYDNSGAWQDKRDYLTETVLAMPRKYLLGLRDELQEDFSGRFWEDDMHKKWMTPLSTPKLVGVRKIDIVGIDAVAEQVNSGFEIADLQKMPAHRVLGLEAA